jgi:hypothetical protein
MWAMIASLEPIVQALAPAFTPASFRTHGQFFLAWILCLGKHRLSRVADNTQPQQLRDHSQRHGLDTYYNFFERSAWNPAALAYHLAVLILTRLQFTGCITLLVDDTLTHKRGKSVWGLGWFRDAVASTKKRVATAKQPRRSLFTSGLLLITSKVGEEYHGQSDADVLATAASGAATPVHARRPFVPPYFGNPGGGPRGSRFSRCQALADNSQGCLLLDRDLRPRPYPRLLA